MLFRSPPGEQEWHTEYVNGSQTYLLRGLKEGLSYRVRVVARGHADQAVHHSEELLVTVPGEAARVQGGHLCQALPCLYLCGVISQACVSVVSLLCLSLLVVPSPAWDLTVLFSFVFVVITF